MVFPTIAKYLVVIVSLLLAVAAGADTLPFEPGETLFYEVRWEQVPVAQVSLEVRPVEQIQGEPAFHFVFRARTYPAIEIFYPVDGRMEAFTDLALTRSLRLEKDMLEGRSQRTYKVDFDWDRRIATYENGGHKKRRMPLSEGTLDMISILYYARSLSLSEGMKMIRPISSGKRTYLTEALVVRRETIVIDGRPWPAFLIEPDVSKAGGVFKKSQKPRLLLWISADDRKIPLKIVSKVWVGAFIVELAATPPESNRRFFEPDTAGS